MYRLLYQTTSEPGVSWIDATELSYLQQQRNILLATDEFILEPFIRYIGKDRLIRKDDGSEHLIEEY